MEKDNRKPMVGSSYLGCNQEERESIPELRLLGALLLWVNHSRLKRAC